MTRAVLLAIGVALLLWTAATALTLVKPGERAVVRRFGRVLPTSRAPVYIAVCRGASSAWTACPSAWRGG